MIGPGVGPSFYSGAPLPFLGATFGADFTTSQYQLSGAVYSAPTSLPGWTFTRASTGYAETVAGVLVPFASGAPRITDKGLLVEEARTNVATDSNAMSAGIGNTVTSAAAVAPDGNTVAQRVTKTDATTPRYYNQYTDLTVAAATTYTVSRYFKYDGYDTVVSLEYNNIASFDLSWVAPFTVAASGITASTPSGCTNGVVALGNGWYRCWATFTSGAAPTGVNPTYLSRITGASGVTVLTAFGQLEAGAFATSYIPTTTASATRAADVAYVTGIATPPAGYTPVVEFAPIAIGAATAIQLAFDDGTAANRTLIYLPGSATVTNFVTTGNVAQANEQMGASAVAGSTYKAALRVNTNDLRGAGNGTLGGADLLLTLPTAPTALRFGVGPTSVQQANAYIRRAILYPTAFNDAALQAATA